MGEDTVSPFVMFSSSVCAVNHQSVQFQCFYSLTWAPLEIRVSTEGSPQDKWEIK